MRRDVKREANDWYIYALCEDRLGNVWVATKNELLKYDQKDQQLRKVPLSLLKSGVRDAVLGPQGHLWLASIDSEEDGVYVLDPSDTPNV